eukprot:TRINITY_DN10685_c0_g1_i10.p1 TRINITY_DN10685_c0_g1~~TRINITY_DN10685_c0_g1_i10.p1  ORF type:complete len:103 (+),score=7.65 TRINITY_DN10685_c0_g1_i10:459-767(+)
MRTQVWTRDTSLLAREKHFALGRAALAELRSRTKAMFVFRTHERGAEQDLHQDVQTEIGRDTDCRLEGQIRAREIGRDTNCRLASFRGTRWLWIDSDARDTD